MERPCLTCGTSFEITEDDLAFFEQISPVFAGKKYLVPPPTLCNECRSKERYQWRAELNLFPRRSALSGKATLSQYPEESPVTIYAEDEWWSDQWNPLSFGRDFDFNRPFFEQFLELMLAVPLMARMNTANENCDYVNNCSHNRNCYLIAGANFNEDCYYGNYVNHSRDSVDCNFIDHCELCYECVDSQECQRLSYGVNCRNCHDSAFLHHCRNCHDCFGSINLSNKQYVFFNEELSEQEYRRKLAAVELSKRGRVQEAHAFFEKHRLKYPHRFMIGEMNEDVSGNSILHSRRSHDCFDVSDVEDCARCSWFHKAKDCRDCFSWGLTAEECYACTEVGNGSNRVLFSVTHYSGQNILYSNASWNSSNLFGCVSNRRNQYCIFNKQYTKEEYERLAGKIVEHMQKTGEWGRFFPHALCPLAYNQSVGKDYFPMTKEEAIKRGARWHDDAPLKQPADPTFLPDTIAEVDDAWAEKTLTCSETGKPYKMIQQELRFYKKLNIPPPSRCFLARHNARLKRRNPRQLWKRNCAKCRKNVETSYAPERPEIVFCESCYLREVY